MDNIKVIKCDGIYIFKLKNRRVSMIRLPNGDYGITFKTLSSDERPTCSCEHINKKIWNTHLVLSKEAIECIAVASLEEMGHKVINVEN